MEKNRNSDITLEQALEVLRREYPGKFMKVEEVPTRNTVAGDAAFVVHHKDGWMQVVAPISGEIIGLGISLSLRDCVDEPLEATATMHVRLGVEIPDDGKV